MDEEEYIYPDDTIQWGTDFDREGFSHELLKAISLINNINGIMETYFIVKIRMWDIERNHYEFIAEFLYYDYHDETIEWFNDWYEGQKKIALIGIFPKKQNPAWARNTETR